MNVTEHEIETLIAENPWLLGPNYELVNLKGNRGKGRGIRIGTKEIDVLLINTIDERPAIVEIKAGVLKREHIGQLAEYNALALVISASEELARYFTNRVPELFLVGENIENPIKHACNLMGIKTRTFGGDIPEISETILKLKKVFEQGWKEGDVWRARHIPEILNAMKEIFDRIGAKYKAGIYDDFNINFDISYGPKDEFWWYVKEHADHLEISTKDVKYMRKSIAKTILQEYIPRVVQDHQGWFLPNFDGSPYLEQDKLKVSFKLKKEIIYNLNVKENRELLEKYFENITKITQYLLEKLYARA